MTFGDQVGHSHVLRDICAWQEISVLLVGKTAVVYGAAGSVGSAVAGAFAREGASVVLAGRTQAALEVVAAAIRQAGATATVSAVDARDETSINRHVDQVVETTGRLDISFNATAVDHVQGVPLTDLSEEEVVGPVAGRVATHLLTARAASRHMVAQHSGVILTFTADAARLAYPNIGSFGIACAAVEALTRTLAAEYGPHGIRVVCLRSMGSPEATHMDETWQRVFTSKPTAEERRDDRAALTLLGRSPSLSEVGNVAALMASDYASPLTANIVNVTCGEIAD
jgi:3-oxoacyl-[acyl-carrier protein] reductase